MVSVFLTQKTSSFHTQRDRVCLDEYMSLSMRQNNSAHWSVVFSQLPNFFMSIKKTSYDEKIFSGRDIKIVCVGMSIAVPVERLQNQFNKMDCEG